MLPDPASCSEAVLQTALIHADLQVDLQAQVEDLQDTEVCSFSYESELDALSLVFQSGHILLLDPLDVIVEEVKCIPSNLFVPYAVGEAVRLLFWEHGNVQSLLLSDEMLTSVTG